SCQGTCQKKGQASETCGQEDCSCADGLCSCSSARAVHCSHARGQDSTEPGGRVAIPDGLSTLKGGYRFVCGRALYRQSAVRRRSTTVVCLPPGVLPKDPAILPAGQWQCRAAFPQNFFIVHRSMGSATVRPETA